MPDEPAWPAALERGEAGAPLAGESRSGDLAVFAPYDGGALVATIDGLGHGDLAADAAEAAAAILRERPDQRPEILLERCHEALRKTRGVVATLAWFDLETERAQLDGDRQRRGPAPSRRPRPHRLRRIPHPVRRRARLVTARCADRADRARPGDCVVMATDGVAADFGTSLIPGLPAPEQAERVLASHARGTDDALVVAVRYLP